MNLPWFAYLFLGIALIGWLLSKPGFRQFLKIITHKKFSKNPKNESLTDQQQRAIMVGLINGEQILSYTNSLITGLSKNRLNMALSEYWGITNSTSANETLDWIRDGGHRSAYNIILPYVLNMPNKEERDSEIRKEYPDPGRLLEFADQLAECLVLKKDDPNFPFTPENLHRGVVAWDCGRLVTVARMAYDAGYISTETAWTNIMAAYEASTEAYTDWKEFATGYVIGRSMWSGNAMGLDGIFSIAEDALTDDRSPWKNTPLK
jgi:hypothetical protein